MGQGPGNQAFRRYTSTASTGLGQGPKLHKREGKRLPVRNRQRWQVLGSLERRLRPPPTQGRTSDPEDAGLLPKAREAPSRLAPRSSALFARQGGLELERSWGSWRSGAGGQVGVGKRLPARIPGARGGHLSSPSEALRRSQRAASDELRTRGPHLGRRPLARPKSSSAPWAQAAAAGARARAPAAVPPLIALPRGWAPLCAGRPGRRGQLWMLQPPPPPPPSLPPPAPRLPGRPGGCS